MRQCERDEVCETKPTQGSVKCEVPSVKPEHDGGLLQTSHFKLDTLQWCETKPNVGGLRYLGKISIVRVAVRPGNRTCETKPTGRGLDGG